MSATTNRRTAAQEILLAAVDLANAGKRDFTEWDLTVAAWRRDNNRFGLRGFESAHPDHKRVMMEIMGQTKKDNPVRRRFIEKLTKPNHYRLTDLGAAEAEAIQRGATGETTSAKSIMKLFDSITPYTDSPPFQAWLRNPEEPRSWLGAAAFLGLKRNTANELNDTVRAIETCVRYAKEWCAQEGRSELIRAVHAGSRSIPLAEIEQLQAFLDVLRSRFSRQIEAIRQKEG